MAEMIIDGVNVIRAGRKPSIERLKTAVRQVARVNLHGFLLANF